MTGLTAAVHQPQDPDTAPVRVLVNGVPGTSVNVQDRGLNYGDGLFETVALREGRALLWDRHIARFKRGCERLRLPMVPLGLLADEVESLCRGVDSGVLKLVVTRGTGGRGYRPPAHAQAMRILALYPAPQYPRWQRTEGVRVCICAMRLGSNPALAGLKHLNRLEQVMARAEWQDPAIAEGLMLDHQGYVIGGTQSNLFLSRDGRLVTPDLSRCGVAGVMRALVMDLARERGVACAQTDLSLAQLMSADEVFLSNSLFGIWPVRELEAARFGIGPLTRELLQGVESEVPM